MSDAAFEARLKKFISGNHVRAEQIILSQTSHTVADAAKALNCSEDDIIKSVVFVSGPRTVVGIVLGNCRASSTVLMKHLDLKELEVATPEQVLERTGYPVGGVPPLGFEAQFYVDELVMEKAVVYSGGGSPRAILKIPPEEIMRVTSAEVLRIRK
jgi:prolyl-tRNA editing enzyme YbaK/EbsC (Cys-tRNA(Pro) deacylase)